MKASIAIFAVLMGFAFAAPKPQSPDDLADILAAYNAIPDAADIAAPVGDAPQTIAYNPTAAASSAIADATDLSTPSFNSKMKKRQAACSPENAGNSPTVQPDDPADFLDHSAFSTIANGVPIPPGFFLVDGFQDLQASASDSSYLTYISSSLTSYDTNACAVKCTSIQGCVSFNICKAFCIVVDRYSTDFFKTSNVILLCIPVMYAPAHPPLLASSAPSSEPPSRPPWQQTSGNINNHPSKSSLLVPTPTPPHLSHSRASPAQFFSTTLPSTHQLALIPTWVSRLSRRPNPMTPVSAPQPASQKVPTIPATHPLVFLPASVFSSTPISCTRTVRMAYSLAHITFNRMVRSTPPTLASMTPKVITTRSPTATRTLLTGIEWFLMLCLDREMVSRWMVWRRGLWTVVCEWEKYYRV